MLYNSGVIFRVCVGSMVVVCGFVFIPPSKHTTHMHTVKSACFRLSL